MEEKLKNLLEQVETKDDLYEIPLELMYGKSCRNCGKGVDILILNSPCNGFGDIVFAYKIANFFKSQYRCNVDIATTQPEKLINLSGSRKGVIPLGYQRGDNCRRYEYLKINLKKKYDLIFNAPVNMDFELDHSDIKKLIPYSNRFNTYYFSEYGDYLDKEFDFHLGLGRDYDGILISEENPVYPKKLLETVKYPYALAYINTDDNSDNWDMCITAFIKMLGSKYKNTLELVSTDKVLEYLVYLPKSSLYNKFGKYWKQFIYVDKDRNLQVLKINSKNDKSLILRDDILPVTNKQMINLMKYSIKDILMTGDQSLSDVLSCCPEKNIWYQTVPWKFDFVGSLSQELGNPLLGYYHTTCGVVGGRNTKKGVVRRMVGRNNFFKNKKKMFDAMLLVAREMKNKKSLLYRFQQVVLKYRSLDRIIEAI